MFCMLESKMTKKNGIDEVYNKMDKCIFSLFFHLFRFIYKFFTMINFLFVCKLLLLRIECDQTFVSRPGGSQNGTFTAPIINNISNHSRQCLYIFLAGPGQRVENCIYNIQFTWITT